MKTNLLLLFLTAISFSCFSQEPYYYVNGEKKFLELNSQTGNIEYLINKPAHNQDFENLISSSFEIGINKQSGKWDSKKSVSLASFNVGKSSKACAAPYIYVKLKQSCDYPILYNYCKNNALIVYRKNVYLDNWYTLYVTENATKNSLDIANEIYETGLFESAHPDFFYESDELTADPLYNEQWGLYNPDSLYLSISANIAWKISTGKNIKVALIEKGVDIYHEDLVKNCPWRMSLNTETNSTPCSTNSDHGTHCAGIIVAEKDNNKGISGVAPDSKLLAISIPYGDTALVTEYFANGVMAAVKNGADIISCSQALLESDLINEAIKYAYEQGRKGLGTLIIAAAGNDSSKLVFPASSPYTLAVGNLTKKERIHPSSNFGPDLDLCAPGTNIISTIRNNSYAYLTGTSMAAPCVAGITALVLSKYPNLNITELKHILRTSCKKVGDMEYVVLPGYEESWNKKYGYGLIDAYNALSNEYLNNYK